MQNKEYYLKEGPLTKAGLEVMKVVKKITGTGEVVIRKILRKTPHLEFVDLYNKDRRKFMQQHERRTAEEILRSGITISCTDNGVVFCAVARKTGIPTRYVQMVKVDGDRFPERKFQSGHVFAECYIDDDVILVDPTAGRV